MKHPSRIGIAAAAILVSVTCFAMSSEAAPTSPRAHGTTAAPAMSSAPDPAAALRAAAAPIRPAAQETLLVPITACRLIDTRKAGGALAGGRERSFLASSTDLSRQGGRSGGCGIPSTATALDVSFQATAETGTGFAIETPYGVAFPNASLLHYVKGQTVGTGATFPITSGGGTAFSLRINAHHAQLIVDVVGYYAPQIEGLIYSGTATQAAEVYQGTPRMLSAARVGVGTVLVTLDRDVSNCTPTTTGYFGPNFYSGAVGFLGDQVEVFLWRLDPTTGAQTPVDGFAYLHVAC